MTFEQSPAESIDRVRFETTVAQWVSAGGQWWIHLNAMLFGLRCMIGRTDARGYYEAGYCCGDNRIAWLLVPRVIARALRDVDEDAPASAVRALFPEERIKPIELDPELWARLCRAAGVTPLSLTESQ